MPKRFWEIDSARGLAVLAMIVFNYAFALRYFGISEITSSEIFWFWFPRLVGALFITIAGISLSVSHNKNKRHFHERNSRRGLRIFALGMLITLATWLFVPNQAVWFGILHLIGLSIIVTPPLFRFGDWNFFLAGASILAGAYVQQFSSGFPWLLWLGLKPQSFAALDYFPMLPWFGFFVLGMALGGKLYKSRKLSLYDTKSDSFLAFLGRNSLAIYLAHIPALLAVLAAAGFRTI